MIPIKAGKDGAIYSLNAVDSFIPKIMLKDAKSPKWIDSEIIKLSKQKYRLWKRAHSHSLSRLRRSRLRAFPSSSCLEPSAGSLPVSEGYLDTSLWRCTDGKGSWDVLLSFYRAVGGIGHTYWQARHSLSSSQNVDHASPRRHLMSLPDEDIIEPR